MASYLGIENATVGYSQTGIQEYLNKINLEVVEELIKTINQTIPQLRESTQAVWMGQSSEAFVRRLEEDSKVVIDTLNAIKEQVEGHFAQIAQNVDNYDQAIAESIANMGK